MTEKNPNPTTELRVMITEDKDGRLNVEWLSVIKGTDVVVPMRTSHVIGQLHAAAIVVAAQSYTGINSLSKSKK